MLSAILPSNVIEDLLSGSRGLPLVVSGGLLRGRSKRPLDRSSRQSLEYLTGARGRASNEPGFGAKPQEEKSDPGAIRTRDRRIRNPVLYPAELRDHKDAKGSELTDFQTKSHATVERAALRSLDRKWVLVLIAGYIFERDLLLHAVT
jgi:hypothetical protein